MGSFAFFSSLFFCSSFRLLRVLFFVHHGELVKARVMVSKLRTKARTVELF